LRGKLLGVHIGVHHSGKGVHIGVYHSGNGVHTIKQMSEQEWNEVHGTETKELNSVKALN